MTQDETIFWELVHDYVLRNFEFSVVGLRLDDDGHIYTLRLKRLGAPESTVKIFPVFVDQMRSCIATGHLPESLLREFPVQLK